MKNTKVFIIQTLIILLCFLLLHLFSYWVSDILFIIMASFIVGAIYGMFIYDYRENKK